MIRPAWFLSATTVALGLAVVVAVRVTATEWELFVTQLLGLTMILLIVGIVSGYSRVMAAATVPLLATVMIEAGVSEDPTWIRSLLLGCFWFVTIEVGWEALDRRDGSERTRRSAARRVQEVSVVVASALVIGLLAAAATSLAPSRTVLLQAVVLGMVLGVFLMLIRRVALTPADET